MKEKVYEYLTKIPCGKVVTYGQIAKALGNKKLARVVGNILHNNENENKYHCYKVVNSKGQLAKNFAFGGIEKQKEKLENDGIEVISFRVDLKKYQMK
ncbi:MAG: MGMT family protein [Bacilli bacterium]